MSDTNITVTNSTSNTKRFFQLSSSMLFEYEFNEVFGPVTSDPKYGLFRIGDFTPVILPMKDGSRLFTCTTDNNRTIKTNNTVRNISIPYTEHSDWWFHFDGVNGGDEYDYISVNEKLGVTDQGIKFVLKKYTSEETTKLTYQEYIDAYYVLLENVLSEVESALGKNLTAYDTDICEALKKNVIIRNIMLNLIKLFHAGDYIYKFYDESSVRYETVDQTDLTYDEVFGNLIAHGLDYYKGTIHEERVKYALAIELWACRNKTQYLSMSTTDSVTKLNSLNYRDDDILLYIADRYAIEEANTHVVVCGDKIPFDTYKIYFVSGYNLDGIYGFHLRLSAQSDDDRKVVLSDLIFNKETDIDYTYLDAPLYISNRIYDRCIEVRIPALKYISTPLRKSEEGECVIAQELKISDLAPVKLEFSIIGTDCVYGYNELDDNKTDAIDLFKGKDLLSNGKVASVFNTSSIVSTVLPQEANSDRIGAHITIPQGKNYLEFGGTWDGNRMTYANSISKFNTEFVLYKLTKVRNENLYDADPAQELEWVGYHEIVAKFYGDGGNIIDGHDMNEHLISVQRYNVSQIFNASEDGLYTDYMRYRPIIPANDNIVSVIFEYTFRLINVIDDVQFIKTASYGLSFGSNQELADYFDDTVILEAPVMVPVVYNKIEKVESVIGGSIQNPLSTRYNKVFYDSSSIVLDVDGNYSPGGTYSLTLSNSPKNYKFTIRQYKQNGDLAVFDLSDAAYKLYSRDKDGKDIVIEPTYSDNMNAALGEIEFNMSINNILKLKDVDKEKRFMSIIVVNQDNTKYSIFDFTYE